MLEISDTSMAALGQVAERNFAATLAAWVREQPELAEHADPATPAWCHETQQIAGSSGIDSEDDVSRVARLRLLRGDDWLRGTAAQDILRSGRSGQLKAFQLECLHWGHAT